jgi:4-hydroxybenzoate polyprenyltransferase
MSAKTRRARPDRPGRASYGGSGEQTRSWLRTVPVAMARASHPRQALLTTAVLGAAAALSGRSTREVGLVVATVLVGQVVLGWHNDVVDARRDAAHGRQDKPIALGQVERGTVAYAMLCAILLLVPLSIANGVVAGVSHLIAVAAALAANTGLLRRSRYSYLPWMASYGLLPAFLSYGGWGGEGGGGAPSIAITVLAALLGIGVHVLVALPGLVDDNADGIRHFPLRLALRTGAPRLLVLAGAWTTLAGAGILIAGLTVGLVR